MVSAAGSMVLPAGVINPAVPIRNIQMIPAGVINPAGRTMEPAADTILSPAEPEPAPAATCCCWGGWGVWGCAELPGGGWESRSPVSVSEEAEPGGAETGFSLDISPRKRGGEERSGRRFLSHLLTQARASAAARKPSTGG
ncbi:unnamed protein product [Menidia menidia]|uniref:(Atlantic silverside) hypothetical protein n=1 Tax=Menidia menidia TaxID=238744 RepID=A0A8S4AV72_9TELE|nr:unnamed protein product [Menidia menidia]